MFCHSLIAGVLLLFVRNLIVVVLLLAINANSILPSEVVFELKAEELANSPYVKKVCKADAELLPLRKFISQWFAFVPVLATKLPLYNLPDTVLMV